MAGYDVAQIGQIGGVPRSSGGIANEVERQISSVMSLEKTVEDLAGRLAPVLSNLPRPATAERLMAQKEPSCALAGGLAANTDRVDGLAHKLQDIIGRIEL